MKKGLLASLIDFILLTVFIIVIVIVGAILLPVLLIYLIQRAYNRKSVIPKWMSSNFSKIKKTPPKKESNNKEGEYVEVEFKKKS